MDINILVLVITTIGTGVAIIATIAGIFSWLRADMQSFESKISTEMKSFESEIRGWKEEIYKEMKDFHGRLCAIESKKNKEITDP